MSETRTSAGPRERIIDCACTLFYEQGYRATGINQVIRESGVAKASFYDHFPSKSDLLLEYVRVMSERDLAMVRQDIAAFKTPEERFYAPLKNLVPWFEETAFRGCPFQNALAEIPPEDGEVQAVVREHRRQEQQMLTDVARAYLCDELGYEAIDCEQLGETYLLIFEGAIATASSVRDLWPVNKAVETMRQLVDSIMAQQDAHAAQS